MFALTRLAKTSYLLALSTLVALLLSANLSQGQIINIGVTPGATPGINSGFRGTVPLPTISFPIITSGSSSAIGGGIGGGLLGISGGFGGSVSSSFSTQIVSINLGSFFPDNGQLLGPPMPTFQPQLNNLFYAGFLFSPFTSDTTGAPWSLLTALNMGGGIGIGGGIVGGLGGFGGGLGGFGGGLGGFGGGLGGFGGGLGGFGGGVGGFAGKGFGGFNGRKAL